MTPMSIDKVPGWSADHVTKLAKSWITSADQVVAASATESGVLSLAQQLGVSEADARHLIELARDALSPEVQAAMGQRFDSDDRGMGATAPRKEDGSQPGGKN